MRCAFLDRRESVILLGNPGTGKSHLATALAAEACRRGKKVRFWRVTELVTQLLEAREERVLLRLKAQLARLDLLVLDELGYVPASKAGSAFTSAKSIPPVGRWRFKSLAPRSASTSAPTASSSSAASGPSSA